MLSLLDTWSAEVRAVQGDKSLNYKSVYQYIKGLLISY